MNDLNAAIQKIEEQQPKERSAVWMVGEQLEGWGGAGNG